MSRSGRRTAPLTARPPGRPRPAGLSHGALSLIAAWFAAGTIALLTGATAVVILLAVGLVAMIAAVISGWRGVSGTRMHSVVTSPLVATGDEMTWHIEVTGSQPAHLILRLAGDGGRQTVAHGWVNPGTSTIGGTAPRRGVYRAVEAEWCSAGRVGLVWWRRRCRLTITELVVAPRAAADGAPLALATDEAEGERVTSTHPGRDELDGVHSWRDGDELTGIHWPSTLRTGEFVVRQRFREHDERWVVHARTGTTDSTAEAARVRHTLERGLAAGATVAVQVDGGSAVDLVDDAAVLHWAARFDPHDSAQPTLPWWKRAVLVSPEPDRALSATARRLLSIATAVSMLMVLEPLGYGSTAVAVVLTAVLVAALVTGSRRQLPDVYRQLLGLVAGVAVGAVLIDFTAIDSVGASLRYLLPQVLVSLVVMQGFECVDRRGARVTLACAAVLTAYAAGIRIDDHLSLWLLAAVGSMAIASHQVGRHRQLHPRPWHSNVTRVVSFLVAAAAVVAILAVVPVPRGPAQLTLPTWLTELRPTQGRGELAAADGSPLLGGPTNNRTSAAGASGYPGFSTTMDTSLRGDLGDEVILRVRSPYPDFWRGQTFSNFDGRTWYVEDGTANVKADRTEGPDHLLKLADGDASLYGNDEMVQTFYLQVDMPNIVFAAYRAKRVLLNAPLWQRSDGALRADVVLPAGSAYTVVSDRTEATPDVLRRYGDLARFGSPGRYLQLPDSVTDRTRALAREITAGSTTTYDAIRAIESWMNANITYDLSAPVPPEGTDSVDQFLFESQTGFCEQIATATAIMLRTLGIPARIATGYVPSSRDKVAGVWISRARDAHAWVEVNFRDPGWIAFDPTASVPLSGEARLHTIGADLAAAIGAVIGEHITLVLLVALGGAALLVAVRLTRRWWRRRRRGRWGLLQDHFAAEAVARGAPPTAANAQLAAAFTDDDAIAATAAALAAELDASAFSATWVDDDETYARTRAALRSLRV
ncbi:unannotated protein [freshwater metagenome]|uniref:Unannotated protein n=1 Tax=freshwater metagenome TaxID=449393 RepID=A0A6J6A861_9ZZZZ